MKYNEKNKIVDLESITTSHTEDITALETLTASHTTDITAFETLIASHTTDILTKLDVIQDGDLSFAKTDGLQMALNSTAKLAFANTFTGLQTINGDLKADNVLVTTTTPTLNTHVTSKSYVDTALIGKQNIITNSSVITLNHLNAFAVTTSELVTDFITVNSSVTGNEITSQTNVFEGAIASSEGLFYNTTNTVSTKITDLQSNIVDLKQDFIQDGDLSIAKTAGLLTALDSSAKLASANTFTGLQTIVGDLKAITYWLKLQPQH